MVTAQEVFDQAFSKSRSPRSDAYKQGVLACLQVRLDGQAHVKCPYTPVSPECDAYFAGVDEGRALTPVGRAPDGFDGPVAMAL